MSEERRKIIEQRLVATASETVFRSFAAQVAAVWEQIPEPARTASLARLEARCRREHPDLIELPEAPHG